MTTTPETTTDDQLLEAMFDAVMVRDGSPVERKLLLASLLTWRPGDPIFETMDVTPMMAAKFLEKNVDNRPKKWTEIAQMERALKNGTFRLNGDTIKFDTDGNMIDGQNRCTAIVKAGVTVRTTIARNIVRETRKTLDIGVKRRAGDVLTFEHVDVDKQYAQTIGTGVLQYRGFHAPSVPEVTEFVVANMEKVGYSIQISTLASRVLKSRKLFGTAAYILADIDPEAAQAFMHQLGTGEMMATGHPILTLRNKVLAGGMRVSNRNQMGDSLAFVFKSWNAWRKGDELRVLRMGEQEAFPLPK